MVTKDDGFDSIFQKARHTTNRFEDWEFVMAFCDRVNEEPEGSIGAVKVLTNKLRVSDDETQMLALAILEACVKNCGVKFHNEVGKFKLLNELIKLLSPKYSAEISSDQLKVKIRGLLFQWRRGLPKQPKIQDAYEMLKKEGLIDEEGNVPDTPPPPMEDVPRDSIINDEKEVEALEKLLKSKNPKDLARANQLIQDRYKKENLKMEISQHRSRELELVQNNAKLLEELLGHYSVSSSQSEVDLIEELRKSCVSMKEKLQKIAEQCTEDDILLSKVCSSSDAIVKVLEKYDTISASVKEKQKNLAKEIPPLISSPPVPTQANNRTESVVESLLDLDLTASAPSTNSTHSTTTSDIQLLLDDFGPFNCMPVTAPANTAPVDMLLPTSNPIPTLTKPLSQIVDPSPNVFDPSPKVVDPSPKVFDPSPKVFDPSPKVFDPSPKVVDPSPKVFDTSPKVFDPSPKVFDPSPKVFDTKPKVVDASPEVFNPSPKPTNSSLPLSNPTPGISLDSIEIKTIQVCPIPALIPYNNSNIILTISSANILSTPANVSSLKAVVITLVNLSPFGVENFSLHVASIKDTSLKLYPPSQTSILPYTPLQPPPIISHKLIIQAITEEIPLKLKFSFSMGGRQIAEIIDVAGLRWV